MDNQASSRRLVKFLAEANVASRRAAADLVKAGRVKVNGQTVFEPGIQVGDADQVEFDGRMLAIERKYYLALNKPPGYVCTSSDPHAERKAIDLIKLEPPVRLFSAGRLDKESEGLLIFSNDGEFVDILTHPRYEVLKTYEVETDRELSGPELEKIRRGIWDDGDFLMVKEVEPVEGKRYRFVLNEGKKREIRRLVAATGAATVRLIRLQMGPVKLGDLGPGCWRELTPAELAATPKK